MSYRIPSHLKEAWTRAITFIALNDDTLETNFRNVRGYMSVVVTAETFGVHQEMVARAVLKVRRAYLDREPPDEGIVQNYFDVPGRYSKGE